ncbi:MAG: hypothetical protein KA784_00030 [Aquabacterium sp.]|nr:hypothetical protein [Aquabacterium sp.]
MSSLTRRGANATTPARLPGIQTSRIGDPNVRQAIDALRESVEVRLGARGDRFERAVTFREFDPQVAEVSRRLLALEQALQLSTGSSDAAATEATSAAGGLATLRNDLSLAISDYKRTDASIQQRLSEDRAAIDGGLGEARMLIADGLAIVSGEVGTLRALVNSISNAAAALINTVNVFSAAQVVDEVTLTDGATVAIDANLSNNFQLTLGGNRTIDNPTNLRKGGVIHLVVRQDATGSRTVTWGAKWDFGSAGTPVLSTAANKVDLVTAYYNGTADKLLATFRKSA